MGTATFESFLRNGHTKAAIIYTKGILDSPLTDDKKAGMLETGARWLITSSFENQLKFIQLFTPIILESRLADEHKVAILQEEAPLQSEVGQ